MFVFTNRIRIRDDGQASSSRPVLLAGRMLERFAPLLSLSLFIGVWHWLSLRYPPFILPGPGSVAQRFLEKIADGSLPFHALVTLSEALPGLLLGTLAASPASRRSTMDESG